MSRFDNSVALRAAVYAAYRLAPAPTAAKLAERLKPETLKALQAHYVAPPRQVAEAVLASGDRDLLVAYARNEHMGEDTALALARQGDPVVGHALATSGNRSERVRDAVWEAADAADPRWRTALIEPLLSDRTPWRLRGALDSRFPELVRHAVAELGRSLPPGVVMDCVLRNLADTEPGGVRTELLLFAEVFEGEEDGLGHPGMGAAFRAAADSADPPTALRAARVRFSGDPEPRPEHDAWLTALRYGGPDDTPPGGVDWAAVHREEVRQPFSQRTRIRLTRHQGCPPELLFDAVRAGLGSYHADGFGPLPLAAALPPEAPDGMQLVELLTRGLRAGWFGIDDVLARVGPASAVLEALHRMSPRRADGAGVADGGVGVDDTPDVVDDEDADDPAYNGSARYRGHLPAALAQAVVQLIAPLGDDPETWIALYKTLARFPGSCQELVAAAVEQVAVARERGTPVVWTRGLEPRFPAEAPEGSRKQLYALLAAAPDHVQRAVIPALDARAVQHLTIYYPLSAAVRTHIYAVCGMPAAVANAAHWEMPQDVIDGLLDLDDPEVNAALYDFGAISQDERVRICAGRPRRGGDRVVPVSPALGELFARTSPASRRNWLLAALDSGDPLLVRAMLGRTRLQTDPGRLRVAIGLWERHGPDAVAALLDETEFPGRRPSTKHPFPPAMHNQLRAAIGADTPEEGLRALQEALAAARSADSVAQFLLRRTGKADERLEHFEAEYGIPLPWAHLTALAEEQAFADGPSAALASHRDCPRQLLVAYLAAVPLAMRVHDRDWLDTALADGRLLPGDLLALASPAGVVVECLTQMSENGWAGRSGSARSVGPVGPVGLDGADDPDAPVSPRAAALSLMAAAGFDPADPEHWAVGVRLIGDFAGTIPELLATAAAIAD
ncbi:hypothetical protein [Yinghuangia soli]|uniref:Uncharacterized protein n=1 Tax=Yinghuangia soli TaxID=2908204 RepID=A0AA41Q0G5_9ACTN|nr:hypothetical protein [Yinghuangia soli]MCF2528952.1 hypothetical protein [Yinghuangia soli]